MPNRADSLSDQQAIQAVKLFYDISPKETWEGHRKLPPERIRTLAADLQEQAPDDWKPFVDSILSEDPGSGQTAARGQLCRTLLGWLEASPELKPYADRAMQTAQQPDMAVDPATGAFIIFLLLAAIPRIEKGPDGLRIIPAAGLEAILKALPAVITAVPKEIYTALAARAGLGG
jgi:hypothetical protein